jgi:hypothetical protein
VPHEAEPRREVREHREALLGGEEVVPLLGPMRARVDERGVLRRGGQRPRAEPGERVGSQLLARPQRGLARHRVEPGEVEETGGAVLVIAPHQRERALPHDVDARRGIRAIADDVAEAEQRPHPSPGGVGEHGVEGGTVGVDVRQDGVTDGGTVNR